MPPEERVLVRGPMSSADSTHPGHHKEPRRDDEQWTALLRWLREVHSVDVSEKSLLVERRDVQGAGKGLFAIQSCPPSTTLFTIPSAALMNSKTLSALYPSPSRGTALTAIQMITLHLLLHRPSANGISHDPAFGPYLSTLPRDFDSHPITWAVRKHLHLTSSLEDTLLESLPRTISSALEEMVRKLVADWTAICAYTDRNPDVISKASRDDLSPSNFRPEDSVLIQDYTWAWLILNTRCIFYQLNAQQAAPENLTLCPILDFANHNPDRAHIKPVQSPPRSTAGPARPGRLRLGGDYVFRVEPNMSVEKDEELYLRYGSHANRTLFVEYGFINMWSEGECRTGTFCGEVDVQDMVEDLFARRGAIGKRMREVLEAEGYWGDWTIHSQPTPAHPSYRLLTALRMLHSLPEMDQASDSTFDRACVQWRRVVMGDAEEKDGQTWRTTLLRICQDVANRAQTALEVTRGRLDAATADSDAPGWVAWVAKNIKMLWREELEVAEAVSESLLAGVEY